MGRFKDKCCIVTGGASGIGEAAVRAFVREGAGVVLVDIDETRGNAVADSLRDTGLCRFVRGSVGDADTCSAAVEAAEKEFGPVAALVNNAARFIYRTVEEVTPEEWRQLLDINVIGMTMMTQHAVRSMKKGGGGAVVNLSSISGHVAQAGTMTYNATKSAVLGLTRCMALDLAKYRIRVNAICPGYTKTPAFYGYLEQSGADRKTVEESLASLTIIGRLATPEDIAPPILFLCSEDAAYITGTWLMVDGGVTAL